MQTTEADARAHARWVIANPDQTKDEIALREWAWAVLRGTTLPKRSTPTLSEILRLGKAERVARIHAAAAKHGITPLPSGPTTGGAA
ncbi:hypothetical protein [Roseovarius sp.]|uniref:hypothetical protein n=1 Tax=Roseovarius sp. TaxID=1486281 RepID=UPI003D1323CB